MTRKIDISVVVPVYKEADNINPFLSRTVKVLENLGSYEIIFCLDPSSDDSESNIKKSMKTNKSIKLIKMSRRFGQPAAVMAGIHSCKGNSCIITDVDLQDPPELIQKMYDKMLEGNDVVYARRTTRAGETLLKKVISYLGYKLINKISDVEIPRNTGDFRIINKKVIEHLCKLKEKHGFLRGLVAYIGFKQVYIDYERDARHTGQGNYNRYFGSINIGFNGLIGFSNFLLSATLLVGIIVSTLALILSLFIIFSFFNGTEFPKGTPTILISILFMGGIQLISIGILGEYIGRIYTEVKGRPMYIIDEIISED